MLFNPIFLDHTPAAIAAPQLQSTTTEPLPQGCGSVTPPGQELAACCMNGTVVIDGQIVASAEVTVTSPRNDQMVLYTQIYSGTQTTPFYQLSLSDAPLNMQVGETITVKARYSSHEKSMAYIVQPGSQRLDIVLPKTMSEDYGSLGIAVQTIRCSGCRSARDRAYWRHGSSMAS